MNFLGKFLLKRKLIKPDDNFDKILTINDLSLQDKQQSSKVFGADYLSELGRIILSSQVKNGLSVLEWGMGNSTKYMLENREALRLKSLYSIDHVEEYYNQFRAELPSWDSFYPCIVDLTGTTKNNRDPGWHYSSRPLEFNRKFDVIYIDGRRRMECLYTAALLCHRHTLVLLHDYRRTRYQSAGFLFETLETGTQFRVMKARRKTLSMAEDWQRRYQVPALE